MTTPESKRLRVIFLLWTHIALALFLLLLSFVIHGRVPGFTADASAALGFMIFFGLGLPLLLIAFAVFVASIISSGRYLGLLAFAMMATALLASFNVWTGIVGSLSYLAFAIWALKQLHENDGKNNSELP